MDLENIFRRTLAPVKRAGCVSVHGLRVACRAGMCVCVACTDKCVPGPHCSWQNESPKGPFSFLVVFFFFHLLSVLKYTHTDILKIDEIEMPPSHVP